MDYPIFWIWHPCSSVILGSNCIWFEMNELSFTRHFHLKYSSVSDVINSVTSITLKTLKKGKFLKWFLFLENKWKYTLVNLCKRLIHCWNFYFFKFLAISIFIILIYCWWILVRIVSFYLGCQTLDTFYLYVLPVSYVSLLPLMLTILNFLSLFACYYNLLFTARVIYSGVVSNPG